MRQNDCPQWTGIYTLEGELDAPALAIGLEDLVHQNRSYA